MQAIALIFKTDKNTGNNSNILCFYFLLFLIYKYNFSSGIMGSFSVSLLCVRLVYSLDLDSHCTFFSLIFIKCTCSIYV